VIVVHHGGVVAQWGDAAAKTPLTSVRKGLLSALYGDAVERGDINLKQTLAELGIDDNEPSMSAEEKRATVRDLLECRSPATSPASRCSICARAGSESARSCRPIGSKTARAPIRKPILLPATDTCGGSVR
jgi:CubicO group peptidase (beta-lactamase class C family)